MRKFLEKLHNFKLLPFFVIVSMIIGIAIGK
ncbi:arsenite transporter, ACR3 family [Thermodesulfovibrio aggregans]|uniref:Arsenite transporter, ACR3 family n=1 Tax=Thermodesulfovibrio aggregans TaxID=86166 RepID=A0A0U9HYH8_9BACT|nr:arsenite transporter, ACR3 family [Thermodesulfovibrio aggregans]